MPTLTQQDPDTADLDYFYNHHAQSLVWFYLNMNKKRT